MSENEFKVGEVVQVKSGGPLMTIAKISEEDAFCTWFDKSQPQGRTFSLAVLRRPPDPPGIGITHLG